MVCSWCDDVTRYVQGSCCWVDGSGRCVRLTDSSLLTLSEVERRALQQAALARLQQLNLGTTIKIPEGKFCFVIVVVRVISTICQTTTPVTWSQAY